MNSWRVPRARKRFGQHFLRDKQVLFNLLDSIHPQSNDCFVEIGCGHGVLTHELLSSGATVCGVELDRDLAPVLHRRFQNFGNRWRLIEGDALRLELHSLYSPGQAVRVVGNLPYNISSPLMLRFFADIDCIYDMHFMFQRELARRIAANRQTKAYGRLSVIAQYYCAVESLFDVAPQAFSPAPRVWSSFARLKPRQTAERPACPRALEATVKAAFLKRRKTLRQSLAGLVRPEEWRALGLDSGLRPQQLEVSQFIALSGLIGPRLLAKNAEQPQAIRSAP